MQEAAAKALARRDAGPLQYGNELGPASLREQIVAYLGRRNAPGALPEPTDLVITGGISQALDLLCTLLTEPGQVVLVEEPTYHLAKLVFRDHGLVQVPVASDAGGMLPEALDEALTRHPGALVYLVPAFGNPTGITLSPERARRVVATADKHGAWLIADEVYRLLDFGIGPSASLSAYGSDRVVALGSFSKILAPGLRLGWLVGPRSLAERLEGSGLLQSGGGQNPLVGAVVEESIRDMSADAHLDKLREALALRAGILGAALMHHAPTTKFEAPHGGYFIWLELPPGATPAAELLPVAKAAGVSFVPGNAFSTTGEQAARLRLSFAHYDAPGLELGAARLASAVQSATNG